MLHQKLKIVKKIRRRRKSEGGAGIPFPQTPFPSRPARAVDFVPAARSAAVNFVQNGFGFGSINAPVSNFRLFGPAFQRRFAPLYTGKLARRARRGS